MPLNLLPRQETGTGISELRDRRSGKCGARLGPKSHTNDEPVVGLSSARYVRAPARTIAGSRDGAGGYGPCRYVLVGPIVGRALNWPRTAVDMRP